MSMKSLLAYVGYSWRCRGASVCRHIGFANQGLYGCTGREGFRPFDGQRLSFNGTPVINIGRWPHRVSTGSFLGDLASEANSQTALRDQLERFPRCDIRE